MAPRPTPGCVPPGPPRGCRTTPMAYGLWPVAYTLRPRPYRYLHNSPNRTSCIILNPLDTRAQGMYRIRVTGRSRDERSPLMRFVICDEDGQDQPGRVVGYLSVPDKPTRRTRPNGRPGSGNKPYATAHVAIDRGRGKSLTSEFPLYFNSHKGRVGHLPQSPNRPCCD